MKLLGILASAAFISAFLIACGGGAAPAATPTTTTAATPTTPPADGVQVGLRDSGGGGPYMFSPSEFTFSAGEEVTFVLTSESEFHTFTVDDLGIDVEIDGGETEQLTFTFDQPGEYTLICIPHELQGMTGTITVQ